MHWLDAYWCAQGLDYWNHVHQVDRPLIQTTITKRKAEVQLLSLALTSGRKPNYTV